MNLTRRKFVKNTFLLASAAIALPSTANASMEFAVNKALTDLYPGSLFELDKSIEISVPQIAENPSVIPLDTRFHKEGKRWLSVIQAYETTIKPIWIEFFDADIDRISTRIKMAKTGPLVIVWATDHLLYYNWTEVKVTSSHCGG